MLVEPAAGFVGALFVERALGFGATKSRTIGFGLLRRLPALIALLESLQVDDVAHDCPRHPAARRGDMQVRKQVWPRCAPAGSMVIQNPRLVLSDSTNN